MSNGKWYLVPRDITEEERDLLTDDELMERIAYLRKVEAGMMMDRAEAAVCWLNGPGNNDPDLEVFAFVSIFHPEIDQDSALRVLRKGK